MKPLVSIIIPTYNRAHLIGETLESVLSQTYQNWECIVVDDGSTDYTDELMEFYSKKEDKIQYHHRPANQPKGANTCRNYGFELSKGKFIQWFDSDDIFVSDAIEKKVYFLENDFKNISICITTNLNSKLYDYSNSFKEFSSNSRLLILYFSGKMNLNTPSIMWKREIVQDYRFDNSLTRAQELDFNFRVLKNTEVKPMFIDEVLVNIRTHHNSLTGAFNIGDLDSIMSELKVRRRTLAYVFENNASSEEKILSLDIYLRAIRRLYKSFSFYTVIKELKKGLQVLPLKKSHLQWKYSVFISLIIFKITDREHRLKHKVFRLKEYLQL